MGNIRKMIKELTMIIFLISFNFPKLMNIGVCRRESNMPPRERAVKRERLEWGKGKERNRKEGGEREIGELNRYNGHTTLTCTKYFLQKHLLF